ncbi:MAG TPA: hypothetical protein VHU22_16010 [Xanthobacteraceae bacterium]|jgi:hypothetical protein|nr:hypothetical protein [Xanthobacteraceae bacterium]
MRNIVIAAVGAVALGASTAAIAHDRVGNGRHAGHFGGRYFVPYADVPGPRIVGPATYTFHPERANPFGPSFFLYQGPACNYIWPYTAWPDKTCIPSNGFHWE